MSTITKTTGLLISALMLACGGGGTSAVSGSTTYNAAASIGDLITYTLDTDSLEYSYEVTAGFRLDSTSGSGTLTPIDGWGEWVYRTDTGETVVLFPNNLVAVGLVDGGLIVGVPALDESYAPEEIAGTYNSVSVLGNAAGIDSSYGTFTLAADGTWESFDQSLPGIAADLSGTWSDCGDGVIEVTYDGAPAGHAMFVPGEDGGRVLVYDIDFGDVSGVLVGQRQASLAPAEVAGDYDVISTERNAIFNATVQGQLVETDDATYPMVTDSPWTGFLSLDDQQDNGTFDSGESIVLLNPDGVFFGGSSGHLMVGARR